MAAEDDETGSEAGHQPAGGGGCGGDETTTNCSETMSTNDEDYASQPAFSNWGATRFDGPANNDSSATSPLLAAGVKSAPPPGRISAENCQAALQQGDDNNSRFWRAQLLVPTLASSSQTLEQQQQHQLKLKLKQPPEEDGSPTTETSIELGTLSQSALASNCHLPPSYGTATLALGGAGPRTQLPVTCVDNTARLQASPFCGPIISQQHANLPPGHHNTNNNNNNQRPSALHTKTIDWRTMDGRSGDPPPPPPPTAGAGPQYTSGSHPQPAALGGADLFAAGLATQNARFISAQPASQHQFTQLNNQSPNQNHAIAHQNLLLDNNNRAPINHLVSGSAESAPNNFWQANTVPACQSNQYYLEASGPQPAQSHLEPQQALFGVQSSVAATLLAGRPQEQPGSGLVHHQQPQTLSSGARSLPAAKRNKPPNPVAPLPIAACQSSISRPSSIHEQQMLANLALASSLPGALVPPAPSDTMSNNMSQQQQQLAARMVRPALLRSHESLASEDRMRSSRQQQQQAHRKRRRHRSTSGRGESPRADFELEEAALFGAPGVISRRTNAGGGLLHLQALTKTRAAERSDAVNHLLATRPQTTISAHCWLIDSSDEQPPPPPPQSEAGQHLARPASMLEQQHHVTVAMMRQQEARRLRQERLEEDCFQPAQQHRRPASSTCIIGGHQSHQQPAAAHLAPPQPLQPIYGSLSCSEMRSNSLRLERSLTKHQEACSSSSSRLLHYRLHETLPSATRRATRRSRAFPVVAATSGRSSPSLSSGDEEEPRVHSASRAPAHKQVVDQAGTLVRLSALLTHVTNLVKRPSKRLKVASQSSQCMSNTGAGHPQPLNSVSGSLRSGGLYSLAVSSSSSSSAYATESSHLSSSHQLASSRLKQVNSISSSSSRQANKLHPIDPPIHLSHMMKLSCSSSSTGNPTPGSSLFYSSTSGNSATTTNTRTSTHGYEYCEQQPAETQFAGSPTPPPPLPVQPLPGCLGTLDTATGTLESRSTTNSTTDEPLRGPSNTLASDNELISGHQNPSSLRRSSLYAPGSASTHKTAVAHGAPTISLKSCLQWNPCKGLNNTSGGGGSPGNPLAEQGSRAARYKCLPSITTTTVHSPGGSVLQSVISLAKADRTFRLRLICSLLVSCLLVGLICVLFGMLYARSSSSSSASSQYNNLSLLIDDSDYDATWLWPATTGYNRLNSLLEATNGTTHHQRGAQQPDVSQQQQVRESLRARLAMIEQSERLGQQLETLNHLNNIQMVNNNFIDISRMAAILNPLAAPTSPASGHHKSSTHEWAPVLQLDSADQDLVSLILLSNLHWPLIKWKHHGQQTTVMEFLSSLSSSSSSSSASPQTLLGGAQTLRNLLAAIMLTESVPHLATNSANLKQFTRLGQLLKSISYELLSCSYSLLEHPSKPHSKQMAALRQRYCLRLLARYRETMHTMRHFDQTKLAKLHDQLDLVSSPGGRARAVTSLPGFFLDRLSVLSPEIVAASLVASEDTYSSVREAESAMNTMLNSDTGEVGGLRRAHLDQSTADSTGSNWQQGKRGSVLELAKLLIDTSSFSQFEAELFEEDAKPGDELTLARHLLHPWSSSQLPHLATPHSYDLFLQPNLTSRHFHGMVRIELRLERRTNFIVMNSAGLQLSDISVWLRLPVPGTGGNSLRELQIRRVLHNTFQEQVYVELFDSLEPWTREPLEHQQGAEEGGGGEPSFAGELPLRDTSRGQNEFVISVSFNGSSAPNQPTSGLHFLQYGDYFAQPDAELKTMFLTQFEQNNARRLFPCFDEPRFKARFQLNLVHEHQHQVLFNSAKRERVPYSSDGRLQMSVFEQTAIPLSSYLICLVVCDSHSMKSITTRAPLLSPARNQLWAPDERQAAINQQHQDVAAASAHSQPVAGGQRHIQVQILAQFEQLSQAEFASQLAPQLLLFYQTHLLFAYPMEKLDLVAIPRPLAAASAASASAAAHRHQLPLLPDTAENMGLIWFRAQLLMLDPNLISQNLIEQVALLLSHQVAHQYLGNLVSVRSWRDAWLLEALCQYLETVALRFVERDWRLDEQFPVATIHDTLLNDGYWLHTPTDWPPGQQQQQQTSLPPESLDSASQPSQAAPERPNTSPGSSAYITRDDLQPAEDQLIRGGPDEVLPPEEPDSSRHKSAILHMLLFTLLPSLDAQTNLLRRCLSSYHQQSMSGRQFWFQFGRQMLQDEATSRRLDALSLPESLLAGSSRQADSSTNGGTNPLPVDDNFHLFSGEQTRDEENSLETNERLEFLMEAWLSEPGFPLITASSYRDKIRLSQERFQAAWWNTGLDFANYSGGGDNHLLLPSNPAPSDEQPPQETARRSLWPIPVLFTTSLDPRRARFIWLEERKLELALVEQSSDSVSSWSSSSTRMGGSLSSSSGGWWFKLNTNQSSLVRVNYDERNWELLTDLLAKSHYSNHLIGPLDRANLLDDALTLMRCGRLSVALAMNLTLYLEVGERDYAPWTSALAHLEQMQILLNQNPLWHRYVLKMIRPISSVIGWKDDGPHLMRKLRRQLFSVALQYGDEKIVAKAKQEFKGWHKSNRFIVPNLQELAYVAGVRYGDQQEWFHCWQKYQRLVSLEHQLMNSSSATLEDQAPLSSDNHHNQHDLARGARQLHQPAKPVSVVVGLSEPSEPNSDYEKRQLLIALASTQNTWILEQFLNSTLDPRKIQSQHLILVVQTLGKNPVARLYLWRFVRLNWHNLFVRFTREADHDEQSAKPNEGNLILETLIIESTKHFSTKLDYEEVSSFFASKRKLVQEQFSTPFKWSSTLDNAVKRSLQFIRANIYWCEFVEPRLTKWLAHNDGVIMS